ncbi:MAG: peptidylprolyl isomerase [Pseudomonadota bacterium]
MNRRSQHIAGPLLVATFLFFLLPSAATAEMEVLERIVAVVNEDVILQSELEREIDSTIGEIRRQGSTPPPRDQLRSWVLDQLIVKKLQLQLAQQNRIEVDDVTLNRALEDIAGRNNMNLSEFRQVLEREGIPYETFREDIREELIISQLQQRQLQQDVQVSEDEVDNHLANLRAMGTLDEEVRLRHILIALPEAASPAEVREAREKAESLRERIQAGEDFADLAVRESDGQHAPEGGDLGWRRGERLPGLFNNALDGMEPGDVSEPLRNPSGYHLIQLEERRTLEDDAAQNEEERREEARELIFERKMEEAVERWIRRLRDEAYIERRLPD